MLKIIQALDVKTFQSVFSYQGHPSLSKISLVRAALVVSFTADGWLYGILLPIIILFKPDQVGGYIGLALTGFAVERGLYFALKNLIRRRRPPQAIKGIQSLIIAADEFSLPSGHTSAAFFFVTFLCAGFSPLFVPLYLWAVAVGSARVILGVHFPGDILMGALMGGTVALLIL